MRVLLVLLAIAVCGFATVADYGLSTDEPWQMNMVRANYELVRYGIPIRGDHRYYGPVFNVLAEAAFQVERAARGVLGIRLDDRLASLPDDYRGYAERMRVKHPVTFAFTLFAYAAVAGLVGILAGWPWAWLGPLVLAFFPRFWGHSFFNPKDIPFAVGLTLATLAAVYVVDRLLLPHSSGRTGLSRKLPIGLAFGALLGLVSGLRIGAAAMLLTLPLAMLLVIAVPGPASRLYWRQTPRREWLFTAAAGYAAIVVGWWLIVTLVHPSAWSNPLGWPFEAASYLSRHPWPGRLLFEGRYGTADLLPWYYLPKYVLLTVPILFLGAVAGGLGVLVGSFPHLSIRQRAAGVLLLLQIGFIPVVGILRGATMYDGMRQFLFVLPGMAVIAAVFLAWFYDQLQGTRARMFAAAVLIAALALIGRDMLQLHPYQYVYFNRLSGGLHGAVDRYELDYWTLSFREATEWLNQAADQDIPVVVAGNLHSAAVFAAPGLQLFHYRDRAVDNLTRPFYFLALYKHDYPSMHSHCPVVNRVARQRVTLAMIRYCNEFPAGSVE